jgi:hypothetical protein
MIKVQVVECLYSKHEVVNSNPNPSKKSILSTLCIKLKAHFRFSCSKPQFLIFTKGMGIHSAH